MPIACEITCDQLLLRPATVDRPNSSLILDWRLGRDEYAMTFTEFMEMELTGSRHAWLFAAVAPGRSGFVRVGRVDA
ncbi:hypothetical protein [Embleya sp. NPDC020630]|uniref:hypothetical protein n=1 Tax=Embleya sp. NPDC020630 TaxID=3363979 RepID=UPI0037B6C71A